MRRRRGSGWRLLVVLIPLAISVLQRCTDKQPSTPPPGQPYGGKGARGENPLDALLRPPEGHRPPQDGVAVALLVDVSGSMADKVADTSGAERPKIDIARDATVDFVTKFSSFALKHPDRTIAVGVYTFSGEDRRPSVRTLVPLGPPDADRTRAAFATVTPKGNTPIGNALIEAKR